MILTMITLLAELQKMDVLQYQADNDVADIRHEIKVALVHGLALSRLPPHLRNIIEDERPYMMLYMEGKTDPVMSVMEYRAGIMLKNQEKSDALRRKAKKLQDEQNRKSALQVSCPLSCLNVRDKIGAGNYAKRSAEMWFSEAEG